MGKNHKQTEWNEWMKVFNIPVDPFAKFPTKPQLCCASRLRLVWVIHHQRCYPMPRPTVLPHLTSQTSANWRILVWHRLWPPSLFGPMCPMQCLLVPMQLRIVNPSCWQKMKWKQIVVMKRNSNELEKQNRKKFRKIQWNCLPVCIQKFNTNGYDAVWNQAVNRWITFLT